MSRCSWKHFSYLIFLVAALIFAVVSCKDSGTPEPSKNFTLKPGETVSAIDGIKVISPTSAEFGTVNVQVNKVVTPPADYPLPNTIPKSGILSGFYEIKTDKDTRSPSDLSLRVPIGDGSHDGNLQLLVLYSTKLVLDKPENYSAFEWGYLTGSIDTSTNEYVVEIPSVSPDRLIFILVSDPSMRVLTENTGNLLSPNALGNQFSIRCKSGEQIISCPSSISGKRDWRQWIIDNVNYYRSNGANFDDPFAYLDFVSLVSTSTAPCLPQPDGGVLRGLYIPDHKELLICVSRPEADELQTVRHEIFHAIQYTYAKKYGWVSDWNEKNFDFLEGTARAAQNSDAASMKRDSRQGFRKINVSLLSDDPPYNYEAQDFWVQSLPNIQSLKGFLIRGPTPEKIDAGFGKKFAESYWSWVIFQAGQGERESSPCAISKETTGNDKGPVAYEKNKKDNLFASLEQLTSLRFTLNVPPIEAKQKDEVFVRIYPKGDETNTKIKAMFWNAGESDCGGNLELSGGEQVLVDSSSTDAKNYYVIVSNTDYSQDLKNIIIEFPSLIITEFELPTTMAGTASFNSGTYAWAGEALFPITFEFTCAGRCGEHFNIAPHEIIFNADADKQGIFDRIGGCQCDATGNCDGGAFTLTLKLIDNAGVTSPPVSAASSCSRGVFYMEPPPGD